MSCTPMLAGWLFLMIVLCDAAHDALMQPMTIFDHAMHDHAHWVFFLVGCFCTGRDRGEMLEEV